MLFVILGLAAGLAITFGPLGWLHAPVDWVSSALIRLVQKATLDIVAQLSPHAAHQPAVVVATTALAVMTPGIVCLGLVLVADGVLKIRKSLIAFAVALGLAGFLFLPVGYATALLVGGIAVGLLTSFATGALLQLPLLAVATVLGIRTIQDVWNQHNAAITHAAVVFDSLAHTGSASLWRILVTLLASLPVISAAGAVLREGKGK